MKHFGTNVVASAIIALGSLGVSMGASAQETLRVIPAADFEVLDPIWSTSTTATTHGYLVYDTLFSLDESGVAQPQMVDSYVISEDKLTYTFTLREGLKWHDGAPVTAADCIASIKRWGARDGAGQVLMGRIEQMRAVDDKTVEIVLAEPFGVVIDSLAKTYANVPFMMPERVASTSADEQISEAIGSGPFVLVKEEWVPGSRIVYRKNADYIPRSEPASGLAGGKVANFDRIEFNIIADRQTALSSLTTGEADLWEKPPIDLLPVIKSNPRLALTLANKDGWFGWVTPNHLHPPFDDPRARLALAWLIDQETYLQAVAGNPEFSKTCFSLFACGTPMASELSSDAIAGYDPDKARALFEQTGWDSSKPIVLLDPTDDPEAHAATLLTAQALRAIGLNPEVQAMDWATLTKRRAIKTSPDDDGWHIFVTYGSGAARADPFYATTYSFACAKAWFGWPCDEELETLRASWATHDTLEERQQVAHEYQKRALGMGSPWLPFGQWSQPVAHQADVEGILPSGSVLVFWNARRR